MLFPFPTLPTRAPQRVVITGAGIVTALGMGWKANAEGFRTGRRAFRPVSLFDARAQRTQIAAEVELPQVLPSSHLSHREAARLDRSARMLLHAAHEAWTQSGWSGAEGPIPLVLGTTSGGMSLGEQFYKVALGPQPRSPAQATRVAHYQAQRQALDVFEALDFEGPVTVIANACASGANAIGHAFEIVRKGWSPRVLAGGYDALSQLVFAGFDSLQALSPTRCRPFAVDRDGLSLGEGAAVVCLESAEAAERRGAEILGEILGYGTATDIHHLTQPQPQGDAALAAMQAACAQAQLSPAQVDYVNAHGTGTALNDSAEAQAITRWAGERVGQLPVSSTKSSIGHLLGAAGAVEAVVCLMALRGQWLPPEVDTGTPDPLCRFPLVQAPQAARIEVALTNSFGFGGANATLLLRR